MPRPTLCESRCPHRVIASMVAEIEVRGRNISLRERLIKIAATTGIDLIFAAQAVLTCPSRNLDANKWLPDEACIGNAQYTADACPEITRAKLTPAKSKLLEGVTLSDD